MTLTRFGTATLAVALAGALSTIALLVHYTFTYVDPGEAAGEVPRIVAYGALPYALAAGGTVWLRASRARLPGLVGAAVIFVLGTAFYVQIVFGPHDSKSGIMIVLSAQIALALLTVGVAWLLNVFGRAGA